MSGAERALQAAVHGRLVGDAALVALLGGPRVHDAPPRGAATPYVAIGAWRSRPLDGADAPAVEHRFEIRVVSRQGGRQEAAEIADRIADVLAATPPAPAGHRLANLALVERTVAEARDRRAFEAATTFRALTEPTG